MQKKVLLVLALAALSAYFLSLNNSFVFDDYALVVHNPFIKSVKFIPHILASGLYDHWIGKSGFDAMYRPLQSLSYSLDYAVWGVQSFGFHLTNLLLHFFNAVLVYFLFFLILKNKKISVCASLFFCVNPVNSSAVSYVAGRADLLSSLFMLLCLLFFVRFRKDKNRVFYILSLFAALAALFSRESALILFLLIGLVLAMEAPSPKAYLLIPPFLFLDFIYLIFRAAVLGIEGLAVHPHTLTASLRILNFLNVIPKYAALLAFPFKLHMFRTTALLSSFFTPQAFIPVLAFALLMLVGLRQQKNRIVFFGLFWFLILLLPAALFLDGYPMFGKIFMAESWSYLASAGFFLVFAWFLSLSKKLFAAIAAVFIIFFIGLNLRNNTYWQNEISFYNRALEFSPQNTLLRKNLIAALLQDKRIEEADGQIKELRKYCDNPFILDYVSGDYYYFTGKPELAIDYYNNFLVKGFFLSYRISSCYMGMNKLDKARDFGLASFKMNPYFEPNLIQLGDIYLKSKQPAQAKNYYRLAQEINPKNRGLLKYAK